MKFSIFNHLNPLAVKSAAKMENSKAPVNQLIDELDECRKVSWIGREEELIIVEFFWYSSEKQENKHPLMHGFWCPMVAYWHPLDKAQVCTDQVA